MGHYLHDWNETCEAEPKAVWPWLWDAIVMASFIVAVLRVYGVRNEAFQAAAHLLLGALVWAWLKDGEGGAKWLVIILGTIEVIMFAVQYLGSS